MSMHKLSRPIIGPRAQKLAIYFTGAVLGIFLFILTVIYAVSGYELTRQYDVNFVALRPSAVIGSMAEGKRLVQTFGCTGCHRANGNVLADIPNVARIVAPNLSRIVPTYSDNELVRLLRAGVKRDGTSAVVMPAESFASMSDDDMATLLAYLRQLPVTSDNQPSTTEFHLMGRLAIALGKVPFSAKSAPPMLAPVHRPDESPQEQGAYLVQVVCSHCHNVTEGMDDGWGMITPPLAMMGQVYSKPDFEHLMRTGKGIGERELGLMSEAARSDFTHMTDPEIDAIHAYLNSVEMPDE